MLLVYVYSKIKIEKIWGGGRVPRSHHRVTRSVGHECPSLCTRQIWFVQRDSTV